MREAIWPSFFLFFFFLFILLFNFFFLRGLRIDREVLVRTLADVKVDSVHCRVFFSAR